MKVYIAGPMTGYEEHNFPAFMEAAGIWRAAGHEVLNPAELDGPDPDHESLAKVPAEHYYRRDLVAMLEFGVEAIAVLPGWQRSTGACGEVGVAKLLRWPVYDAWSLPPADWPAEFPEPIEVRAHELILTLDEYQRSALATAAMDLDQAIHRATLGLGIAGEAGEVANLIKKEIGHGHAPDPGAVLREDGDVLWYVAMVARAYGHTLGDIARANIQKLAHRYPDGFSTVRSVARTDEPVVSR